MTTEQVKRSLFWLRSASALLDVVFIYCFAFCLQQILGKLVYIDLFILFAISWIVYYSVAVFLLKGRTAAKMLTGLQVVGESGEEINVRSFVIREICCKFLVLICLPVFIWEEIYFKNLNQMYILLAVFIIIFFLMLLLLLVMKRPCWEFISSTKTIKIGEGRKSFRVTALIVLLFFYLLTMGFKLYPFLVENKDFRFVYVPEYPVNGETRKYADYIRTNGQDPVDYIFNLFGRYDLVVLGERVPHGEYTQYDLIKRIVSDKRFASKVGNLYTEIGSVSFQDTLTHYLNTTFPCEDSLDKATAVLQRNSGSIWPLWSPTNHFDLLKHINKLNRNLPDSLKINWYYTDIPVDWETMTVEKRQHRPKWEARDKIMADNIISIYENKVNEHPQRKKGLVIMNSYHSYGLIRDEQGKKTDHFFNRSFTTAFLMDSLKTVVCNVLINTVPFGMGLVGMYPVQHGKWDKAFSLAGNPKAGFDLKGSPFGNDGYDLMTGYSPYHLKYQDVYAGFIFCNTRKEQFNRDFFPYMLDHFKDTLLRRSRCVSSVVETAWKDEIKRNPEAGTTSSAIAYAFDYNLIHNFIASLIIFTVLLIALKYYQISNRQNKIVN